MTRVLTRDDLEQFVEVRVQSFGVSRTDREEWIARVDADTDAVSFGTFDGTKLLGGLRVLPGGQWWLGRSVPMGGVAAVVVRPEARGRGVARSLLFAGLDWMRDHEIAVSTLHPASTRVYRSAGWELAGVQGVYHLPTRTAAGIRGGADLAVERLEPEDRTAVRACYDSVARRTHGFVDRSDSFWLLRELSLRDDGVFTYGVRGTDGLRGYVRYHQEPNPGWWYRIVVDEIIAQDHDAAASLWRFLGGHSMQVRELELSAPSVEQVMLLTDEQDVTAVAENQWMARIVDLAAAVSGRGYPGAVAGSVTVEVNDPWPGGPNGCWRIAVADGAAVAEPTTLPADITIDVGALSGLMIGRFAGEALVRAGRLQGPPDAVAALSALFAGPAPQIGDDF